MENFINNVNFHNLAAQKYWSPPASWSDERKHQEVQNAIFSGEYIGARKMDGAFYKFVKDEDGNMELLGRSKGVNGDYLNKLEWVPQLQDVFDKIPNGSCVIGEIYFPHNEGSNHVTTIMGCLKDKAIVRQNAGEKLNYYIFDVLAWDNQILYTSSIETRIKYLQEIKNIIDITLNKYIQIAQYFSGEELWIQLQEILANGGEGIVITKCGTSYQPDKRPARQTFKVKRELKETLDVVIMGANAPTREYNGTEIETWEYWENCRTKQHIKDTLYMDYSNGAPIEPVTKNYFYNWAGSLVIGAKKNDKIVVIGSLSGMTEEVLANWKDYKGKVAEITGMQIYDTGGIRHPKFVCWRPDLTPNDTDWYRIFGEQK